MRLCRRGGFGLEVMMMQRRLFAVLLTMVVMDRSW